MIVFDKVTKEFDERTVLDNVSFTIEPGEFVCITGPSGAGKSTIIHLLIRAETATTGTVLVDNADIAALPLPLLQMYRRRTGILFQDYKLLVDRTVFENVAFAMEACGESDEEILTRVTDMLTTLGIEQRADAFPEQLSGGEKTRVALARALINRPSILIADEPTGNIDPDQSAAILQILRNVQAQGTTVILATHDKLVVDALGVRVLRLESGKLVRDSVGGYVASAEVSIPSAAVSAEEESASSQKSDDSLFPQGRHVPKSSTRGVRKEKDSATDIEENPGPLSGHVKLVEV